MNARVANVVGRRGEPSVVILSINVLVSANLNDEGLEALVVALALNRKIRSVFPKQSLTNTSGSVVGQSCEDRPSMEWNRRGIEVVILCQVSAVRGC